jgi:hypothetical protein
VPPPYIAMAAATGLMLMVVPPLIAGMNQRYDLRSDLLQLEVLRPWPVPGWRLVAAELLAPATTVLGWTLAGCGLLIGSLLASGGRLPIAIADDLGRLGGHRFAAFGLTGAAGSAGGAGGGAGGLLAVVLPLALGLLLVGVPITLLAVALQNLAVLVLPGWTRLGIERRAGSSFAGLRLVVRLGHLVAIAAGLLPAALLVAAALFAASRLDVAPAPWQAPGLALVAALPLLAEVGLLVRLAGALWDRLDPSQDLLNPEE